MSGCWFLFMRHSLWETALACVSEVIDISFGNLDSRKEYNQSDFNIDHLVISMCRVISCVVGRRICYDQFDLLAELLLLGHIKCIKEVN